MNISECLNKLIKFYQQLFCSNHYAELKTRVLSLKIIFKQLWRHLISPFLKRWKILLSIECEHGHQHPESYYCGHVTWISSLFSLLKVVVPGVTFSDLIFHQ